MLIARLIYIELQKKIKIKKVVHQPKAKKNQFRLMSKQNYNLHDPQQTNLEYFLLSNIGILNLQWPETENNRLGV